MKQPGAPFDASEPPRGDFVRYVEALNAQSAARDARERAQAAPAIRQPGPTTLPAHHDVRPGEPAGAVVSRRAGHAPGTHDLEAMRRMIVVRAGERLRRAAGWMLLAGIALILLAVVPDDPFIDTPLPGILLAGAGLAMRRHFRKA